MKSSNIDMQRKICFIINALTTCLVVATKYLIHSWRVNFYMVEKSLGHEPEVADGIAPVLSKHDEMNAGTQLSLFFLFSPRSQTMMYYCPKLNCFFQPKLSVSETVP